jgi:predicted RND superfamily exporter protein
MMKPEPAPSARSRAFVAWALRHGRLLWAIALLLAIPAVVRTASLYLHLRTEIEQLLPESAPSVKAIHELRQRLAGLQHLGVIVDVGETANLPAGERLLDELGAKIRAYPPELVRAVRTGNAEERAFVESHAALYIDVEDLRTIRERIEARRDHEVMEAMGTSLDDEPPPPLDFSDLKKRYGAGVDANRFPTGRFSSEQLHLTLLLVEVGEFSTGRGRGAELLSRVQADLAALGGPDRYAPGMRVGYTGDVAISVEETAALMTDLSLASVLVMIAVIVAIVAYFRWRRSVIILLVPLLLAAVYSFALASLPPFNVTELNSNTAFLGSIILGNGINFGVILLARYAEERRGGAGIATALEVAVWSARPGTFTAALAAGVAYASLAITTFRGFRQFGYIGGLGMLLSWLTAFVLMPSLIAWLDDGAPARLRPRADGWLIGLVARLITRRPGLVVALGLVVTLGAVWSFRGRGADMVEYDFSKLRRADTWKNGEGYWGRRMDELLGTYLTPTVILADDEADARAIAAALLAAAERPPLAGTIASLRTLDDVLPPDQAARLSEASAIRAVLAKKIRALLPERDRERLERALGDGEARPITAADLPATFTIGLRERDGTMGRTVLVFPRPSSILWQGTELTAFVEALRGVAASAASDRPAGRVTGSLPLSADIIASIRKDGVLASAVAFTGVVLVVVLLFRLSATTATILGSLAIGVLWLAAAMTLIGVRVNFANFIAYPITFGIGADYAVNVMSRAAQGGTSSIERAVRSTGGAVGLCSLTTILGYGSLLFAQNRALYLFGVVAVAGEVATLVSAVVLLPAALLVWSRLVGRFSS